jgi:hypothetical protein
MTPCYHERVVAICRVEVSSTRGRGDRGRPNDGVGPVVYTVTMQRLAVRRHVGGERGLGELARCLLSMSIRAGSKPSEGASCTNSAANPTASSMPCENVTLHEMNVGWEPSAV